MSETNQVQGRFGIQKVYVKDLSFEAPNTPAIFAEQKWEPEVNVQLNTRVDNVGPAVHEVVLTVTVTAKVGDKTAYLAEVKQAGIFQADGFEQSQMGHLLGSFCPSILFPYVREAVSDLVTRGGFPQMLLAPVNFDLIYAQHLQQQQQAAGAAH